MLTHETVAAWLDAYSEAWQTYDPQAIANLFSVEARYTSNPYSEPVTGREAIVAGWLEQPDSAGTYASHYEPVLVEGNRAVANGWSRYFEDDGTTLKDEFNNIFILEFDDEGRCTEYREWYMRRPKSS